ncbi:MAG TPA: adenylate/guanylate cyclase domain-containing protein [Xanthobacteraceae bacterium]|nr:adenylate/guanylate cyclase domain-containing protein [Xanthobacteraceae bacterium]
MNPADPIAFDYEQLAAQLVAHRLSQPDVTALLDPGSPERRRAAMAELTAVFQRNAAVFAASRAIENRAPLSEILSALTAALTEALRARLCRLVVADGAESIALRGDGCVGEEPRLPAVAGISRLVLDDGETRTTAPADDPACDPASDLPAGEKVRELMCVALPRSIGERIGVMQLFDKAEGGFTEADRRLAELAAPYLAEMLTRAGLLRSTGSEIVAGRLVERVGPVEIVAGADLMLSKILAVALDVLNADRGSIFLHDKASDELVARHAEGLGGKEFRIDSWIGIVGAAFRTGLIVNVADAYQDPRFHPGLDWLTGYRTRSVLCSPIVGNDGRPVGAVQLINKRGDSFTATDERRLKGLASQMGIAIDYAALFEQVLAMKSYNESMLNSLTNGVVTLDLAGVVTYLNPAAARILRLGAARVVGRELAEAIGEFNAWVGEAIGQDGGEASEKSLPNSEFYIESEDSWISVNLAIVPLRDTRQTPLGTMLVIEDVQRENELRRTMSRYLSNKVIDRLMFDTGAGLEGSSHEVTILFSDIRGYTPLTERLGAGETVRMLNEYFSFMEDVVTNRNGIIDKYIGDAIMAVFGSPFQSDDDAANAVRAATDMLRVLDMLNARRRVDGKADIHIGVGIGTGICVTGNIGSPKRMDFTVIGDPVNLASRIETATKTYGAEIIVCGTTWSRLAERPRARRLDVVRLRGQTRPTELWEILEHRADIPDSAIEAYDRGLASYFEGVWDRALPEFENALATRTGDKAARLMIERCRRSMETQPVDWQGVVELD